MLLNTKTLTSAFPRVLVYGDSGVGKTTFAASYPKPYFLDCDRGVLSQRGKDIPYEVFNFEGAAGDALNEWELFNVSSIVARVKAAGGQTAVVDSFSTLTDDLLEVALDKAGKHDGDPDQDVYGRRIKLLRDFLSKLRLAPIGVVATAHQAYPTDKAGNRTGPYGPALGGKLPSIVMGYFDEVYRLVMERRAGMPVRMLYAQPGADFNAKSRLGLSATGIELPNGKSGYDVIQTVMKVA